MKAHVHERHRSSAPSQVRCATVTVSDTKTEADDRSGALLRELLAGAGHLVVSSVIVRDEPRELVDTLEGLRDAAEVVIFSGGTGLTHRDSTPEALLPLIDKPLPGFGELFRMLSFEEIGSAAIMSRAFAGASRGLMVFALPGSPAGVRLAMTRIILPELGHTQEQLRR